MQEKINIFKDKNILVVGLARSGTGAANLLSELGARVTVIDNKSRSVLEPNIKKLSRSVKVVTDGNPSEVFDTADMIVISPGVPLVIAPLERAKEKGIPVIGELELAYQVIKSAVSSQQSAISRGETVLRPKGLIPSFIGITGTNGKSTTTTLADLMLREAGFKTLLGGNIGIALTEEVLKAISNQPSADSSQQSVVSRGERPFAPTSIDYIVTEISSFQLETIKEFSPKIAALLNITPDHLDRYHGMEEYIDAKSRIFENQTRDDFLILNADDPEVMKVESVMLKVKSEKPNIFYFSRKKEVEGIYLKDDMICSSLPESIAGTIPGPPQRISADEIRIQGVHNIENAMAASLVALLAGCPLDAVRSVLKQFPGLEHRLEFVREIGGVKFINDSKGTNIGAVMKSLEGFTNVILIMGGQDKGSDFSVLKSLIRQKVKTLILIGTAKGKIAEALEGATEILMTDSIISAVEMSLERSYTGDVVLLSPGCASFDMFQDFEDRGRKFKEAVIRLGEQHEDL